MGISKNLIPSFFKSSIDIDEEKLFNILEENSSYLKSITDKRMSLIRKMRVEMELNSFLELLNELLDLFEKQISFFEDIDETLSSIMRSMNRNYNKIYTEEIVVVESESARKQKTTLKQIFHQINFTFSQVIKKNLIKENRTILKSLKSYNNELVEFFEGRESNNELFEENPLSFTEKGKRIYFRRLINIFKHEKYDHKFYSPFFNDINRNLELIVYAFDSRQLSTQFKFSKSHHQQIDEFFRYLEPIEGWKSLIKENKHS